MTTLRPWRAIAVPHGDIADGSFDESLFAADLGLVDQGKGPADYLDPVVFCEKTYLTESLYAVLAELIARFDGDMSAAGIYRLQTEFGCGKTHTLLAAYHLFRDPTRVAGSAFVGELAQRADFSLVVTVPPEVTPTAATASAGGSVPTFLAPSPAVPVTIEGDPRPIATAGVIGPDRGGRIVVTTALHAVRCGVPQARRPAPPRGRVSEQISAWAQPRDATGGIRPRPRPG